MMTISLLRFRRAALLVALSASVASCDLLPIGRSCNGPWCGTMTWIVFDGGFSYGNGLYDGGTAAGSDGGVPANAIEIDIEEQTNGSFASVATCWLTLAGSGQVVCDREGQLRLVDGNGLLLVDVTGPLSVTLSRNGSELSQEILSGTETKRPCGCDNGTATTRTFHVALPSPGDGGV